MKTHKFCKHCGVERTMESFSPDKRLSDGRRNICKECAAEQRMERYFSKRDGKLDVFKEKSKFKVLMRKKMRRAETYDE